MRNHGHWALLPGLTALALAALASGAQAQVTAQQQSAIKANCRSDFMSKCSGVTPGGKDALACLQKNVASLSGGCKTAVSATLPPPAPAAAAKPVEPPPAPAAQAAPPPPPAPAEATPQPAPARAAVVSAPPPKPKVAAPPRAAAAAAAAPTAEQQSAMRAACRNDFMSKCAGVQPGGKEALVCLQKNVGTSSSGCKQVVSATMGAPAPAAATATAPAAPAAAVATAPAAGPTPAQLKAVKFTCRNDFKRNCKGIAPGGQEAIMCLQRNAARLTPNCKTSLADIADSMPAGAAATATPAATTTEVTVERRRLPPGFTPAGRIIRRVMERNR